MSRRDTILIAVLVNAGLLIVLFSTALKSNPKEAEVASIALASAPMMAEIPLRKEISAAVPGDEVDQVLSQYSQTAAEPFVKEETSSFAEELKAIALPENPVVVSPQPIQTPASSEVKEVIVKKGDVLEKIARANHTSVEEIMKLNQLTHTNLKIGQVLKVSSKAVKKAPVSKKPENNAAKYYTVKNGDNPWTIAVKNHIKVEELLKLNDLDEQKARHLKPGDRLRIQ